MARGDGATTRQMQAAPIGSHFVWVNSDLSYPRKLAIKIGRKDLEIVTPSFFRGDQWRGIRFVDIVVDHAAHLDEDERRHVEYARKHSIREKPTSRTDSGTKV